ncbi:LisH, partial [Cooperia oncophora]
MDTNGPPSHMGPTLPMSGGTPLAPNNQGGIDELSEKQLTPEVLQILMTFLRKNGLSETEEALSKEANNLLVMGDDAAAANFPSSEALMSEFDSLIQFVDSSFDFFQAEFQPYVVSDICAFLYQTAHGELPREFFKRYCKRIPTPYEELVYKLERIQSAHQAQADTYEKSISGENVLSHQSKQLEIPLARTPTIKNIAKDHITIEASDVISKLRSSVESQMGGILGQVSRNEKRHKMYYGVLKDDVSQTIEKKKTRGKELKDNKKSQALAPVPDRIPLPPLSEALREERRKAMRVRFIVFICISLLSVHP